MLGTRMQLQAISLLDRTYLFGQRYIVSWCLRLHVVSQGMASVGALAVLFWSAVRLTAGNYTSSACMLLLGRFHT